MNYLKTIITWLIIASLFSCGNNKEDKQVLKAQKEVLEIVKDLPKIKKELDELKKRANAQQVTGFFEMNVDSKKIKVSNFSSKNSKVSYFKGKAVYLISLDENKNEYIAITIVNKDLYNLKDRVFMASMYPNFKDLKISEKRMKKGIQFIYVNEKTKEEYASNKGTITLNKFSDTQLKFSYDNQGVKGDYKENNFLPMTINISFKFNFITNDLRNK